MDAISTLFAAILAAMSQQSAEPTAKQMPSVSKSVPAPAAPKLTAPPAPRVVAKSEHACADFGKPDATGNLNYCF